MEPKLLTGEGEGGLSTLGRLMPRKMMLEQYAMTRCNFLLMLKNLISLVFMISYLVGL